MSGGNGSTATATTGTAEASGPLAPAGPLTPTGRFAPSPTGRLHLGSLLAAFGSALDARRLGGRWLLRMEDLDLPRTVPGAAAQILRTLEALGFEWDGPVLRQSTRLEAYQAALEMLRARGDTFECSCSRSELRSAAGDGGYPGTCRAGPRRAGHTATRFRMDETVTERFIDRVRGPCALDGAALGDVVVRRRDGIIAYQLAVVVDDAAQGVTEVVRGADLLESTGWQLALQRALGLPAPRYAHLPLLLEADGSKLAKSRRAVPLDPALGAENLVRVLRWLGQEPPAGLERASIREVWAWGLGHWSMERVAGLRETRLSRA